uniref:Caspase a n=1 Tax=Neogobius melanostomus TaxID=47308 RepID=A0A8C6WI88_9GOBI
CADKLMYFVENVSEDVLDQLLDRLLWKKLLNSGEKDKIIKANRTTTNKARGLIDKVMNKGDEVRLILHLQMKDLPLYKHLCQTCDCVIILCCSCTGDSRIIHIFRCKFKEYFENYLVLSVKTNRVALLITNITFADKKYNRPGAEKDEENMEKLLSTLGYEVVKHTNLTAKKMENALDDFSKHPKLKETDSVFVVISSHGQYGAVHGVNHKPDEPDVLKVDDIYDNLNAKSCPALVDKPKIIIIQACRGIHIFGAILISEEKGSVLVEADDVTIREIKEDVSRYRHKENDFIALLSSTPHSYRHTSQGSFLIQFTVDIFRANVLDDHIEDLFLKVMKKFKEEKELPYQLRQMATKDRCTLTHHFFLFPGDLKQ